ncbi:unnamed protein product [Sphagnum troendelagicum]|uniref:Uncharacterized protein n=1 Tax=Sphagnum troendelagicum TaxID=128251 RepID=A0ABP0T8W9_9BRYO
MEDILPDTDNIDIERQTSDSVSNMAEGQGKSDTKERIGVITATIVTVGTCIQAYTFVIGSNKMQPHFPP